MTRHAFNSQFISQFIFQFNLQFTIQFTIPSVNDVYRTATVIGTTSPYPREVMVSTVHHAHVPSPENTWGCDACSRKKIVVLAIKINTNVRYVTIHNSACLALKIFPSFVKASVERSMRRKEKSRKRRSARMDTTPR